jgi:hypothetical protein
MAIDSKNFTVKTKLNSVAVVRKQTIPNERPPNFAGKECCVVSATIPTAVNLGFVDRSCYFFIKVAPQLSSRGRVDPALDPSTSQKIWYGRKCNPEPLDL